MITAKTINIIIIAIIVILALAIMGNVMTKPVGRDEQMYCTGAALMAQGKMIYRDFSYAAQMPCHPLLYAAFFKMFNTTRYLLVGRLVSCVCDILVLICIVYIYRHIFKPFIISGTFLGLGAAVLYIFNPLVDYANGYAWNHDVVILCVMLSLWLFLSTDFQQKSKYWRTAAIGALLTFATCMRVTTVLVELLFFVMLLSMPARSIRDRLKNALPFLIAGAVVSIWPVWILAQAPWAFFLNLVKIPMLYGQWLHEIGMVHDKFALTLACLTTPGYFVLVLLAIYFCIAVLLLRRRIKTINAGHLLISILLTAIFFIIALIPPTMWRQYLAIPVPFLVISFAFPLSYLRKLTDKSNISRHFKIASALMVLALFVAVLQFPVVLHRIPIVLVPERWVPNELHNVSRDIANTIKTKDSKLVLTLAPLLAIEGGSDIYVELSCGSIIYRIADYLSPEERRITHTAGPETLVETIEKNPPSAAILGVEMDFLEESLRENVIKADWERKNYEYAPFVYIKP